MKWLTKKNGTFKEIGTEALTVIPVKNTMTVLIMNISIIYSMVGYCNESPKTDSIMFT